MEPAWVPHARRIAKTQAGELVDAKIVDHRMQLKRTDGQVIDAGPIKVKPPGTIVVPAYYIDEAEPDVYLSKDGIIWYGGASEGKFHAGTLDRPNSGCYTGDRFLVPYYSYDGYSSVLQSRDGGTWAFHRDTLMFNNATNGNIYGMAADGKGLVLAVGTFLGEDETASIAISRDFGETWGLVNDDPSIFPFNGSQLFGVCIKSEMEWMVNDGYVVWYTRDGGLRWSVVPYPSDFQIETTYASGMRYFRGHWWLFGTSYATDEFDTCLIKSEDGFTWVPVVTPWSGTYPPVDILNGYPHAGSSGYIENMEYDESSNTVMCNGYSPMTDSYIMMSTDGGDNWFEVGPNTSRAVDAVAAGYKGVYNWPLLDGYDSAAWDFGADGGIAYGYGWWFIVNPGATVDENWPAIIRISLDGSITEIVNPPQQLNGTAVLILAGGDMNF